MGYIVLKLEVLQGTLVIIEAFVLEMNCRLPECRNLIKKPWVLVRVPYMNPTILGVIGAGFLNQVRTLTPPTGCFAPCRLLSRQIPLESRTKDADKKKCRTLRVLVPLVYVVALNYLCGD